MPGWAWVVLMFVLIIAVNAALRHPRESDLLAGQAKRRAEEARQLKALAEKQRRERLISRY